MNAKKKYLIPATGLQTCGSVSLICASNTYSVSGDVVSGGSTGSEPGGGL